MSKNSIPIENDLCNVLDELIEEKNFTIALKILSSVQFSFSKYQEYKTKIEQHP